MARHSSRPERRVTYLPPKIPPTPKQAAEQRVKRVAAVLRILLWIAVVLPLAFMVMAYGYSDQAPAALREVILAIDAMIGRPVWLLIGPKG
jgi:hypothetical protein